MGLPESVVIQGDVKRVDWPVDEDIKRDLCMSTLPADCSSWREALVYVHPRYFYFGEHLYLCSVSAIQERCGESASGVNSGDTLIEPVGGGKCTFTVFGALDVDISSAVLEYFMRDGIPEDGKPHCADKCFFEYGYKESSPICSACWGARNSDLTEIENKITRLRAARDQYIIGATVDYAARYLTEDVIMDLKGRYCCVCRQGKEEMARGFKLDIGGDKSLVFDSLRVQDHSGGHNFGSGVCKSCFGEIAADIQKPFLSSRVDTSKGG